MLTSNSSFIEINRRRIGPFQRTYIIAEMSANHGQSFEHAVKILHEAQRAGADAIKLQTYTPDTITIDCRTEHFQIGRGTMWEGRNLHDLYGEAYTPWDWQPKLKDIATQLGMDCFSTPFDFSAVDFLEQMEVPAYKIASFELVDLPLIQRVAATGRPLIMSTGMASLSEITEAVDAFRSAGGRELALLKCTSAYPSPPDQMNLRTLPDLAARFNVPVGLSDHTLDVVTPVVAVSMGAAIIEKHLTLSRAEPGPDSAFSLEPNEFKAMVEAVRTAGAALGNISYEVGEKEKPSRAFRRSLFVVEDIAAGESLTARNVRSIRPAAGLPPKHLPEILGRKAVRALPKGTPLSWDLFAD
ncbi:MAG TPA: pseudaminic acid synthase [Opitutaceae bacterium]|nr:pseudaminic acid synthase [Opitutaceae bacterium]